MRWQDRALIEARKSREAAWEQCHELARTPRILDRFEKELEASGVVGVGPAAKLVYLAVTSRLLGQPVSISVKGPSSGGKSYLVEQTLRFFPKEAYYALTAMSEKVLVYSEEPLSHRMLVIYEAAGLKGDFASYIIRSLLSEGRVRYETVEKTPDGMRPRLIEREGPTGLIVTTTAVKLHPENETRLLTVRVDDSARQTKAVMQALACHGDRKDGSRDRSDWLALQAWLAAGPCVVRIPFADNLVDLIPPLAVRLRRDFRALLTLIETHALVHQATRKRDLEGSIIATLEDYAVVRELVADVMAQGVGAQVPQTVRATVHAVAALTETDEEALGPAPAVSVTALAQYMDLDKSVASRRVKDALEGGYLRNEEERPYRQMRLILGDPLPDGRDILPTVEMLERTLKALEEKHEVPAAIGNPITEEQ